MEYQTVSLESADGVGRLTLNRPDKRNALSRAMRDEIVRALDELEADAGVRAVILVAQGPGFCAGFDRSELAQGRMEDVFAEADAYHRRVYRFAKPIVAAIRGPCLGGGCDLAAMCDVRIADTTAVFGQPQVRFGAPALYDLMRTLVGEGVAREMCLTGRSYDAREALAAGLVNRVVEPPELDGAATETARSIATLPPGLAEGIKRRFVAAQPVLFE